MAEDPARPNAADEGWPGSIVGNGLCAVPWSWRIPGTPRGPEGAPFPRACYGMRSVPATLGKQGRHRLALHHLARLIEMVVDDRAGVDSDGVIDRRQQLRRMDR